MYSKFRKKAPKAAAVMLSTALITGSLGLSLLAVPVQANTSGGYAVSAAAAVPTAKVHSTYRIVAIGDSLTAGYEPGMNLTSVPYGFVERVYEQALFRSRAAYSNYGILGLKLDGLQRWLKATESGQTITADGIQPSLPDPRAEQIASQTSKLQQELKQADLVLISIGGNDFRGLLAQIPSGRSVSDEWLKQELDRYEASLEASIRSILTLQPKAQIVISDQYSPVPDMPVVLAVLGLDNKEGLTDNYQYLLDAAKKLKERLEHLTARIAKEGYQVQGAYSSESFINRENTATYITKGDIHPTQKGYAYMAEAFTKTVWGETLAVAERPENVEISIVVDGKELINPNKPVLKSGRTYVAFRDIADAMKATTQWDNKTSTVTITYGENVVAIKIGESAMTVNGKKVAIDSPAFLHKVGKEQKTYVPLAVLADGLGFQVEYRAPLKTAFINK
ncbi:stalk domain-containing protein [Paenibacillus sp. GCM10012307]|uniref:Copper amine oxidase n=1 Tax=Paenibacillus roseus TaxID=2798579 RepID=A0A934IVW9_9BACL|nr:stalk domain-containing protein [Paenibacillus roseus]MBJ6360272.1 copper amine oxidase [Paenibacillus roseus]